MPRLAESLTLLDEAVTDFLSEKTLDSRRILQAIFAVNNEIGQLLRPSGDPALKALQFMVNDVTVAAKAANRKKLQEAMERLSKASRKLK
ncbi:MAG: hypothetical protein LYZ69_00095 [Nitrososphaerales archaeon]|nr:hypothetical protein [Nitrososphaerales archaeon]